MPGDKKTPYPQPSAAGLKSDACANLPGQNVIPGKVGILGGVDDKGVAERVVHPSPMYYDHHHPGHSRTFSQADGSGLLYSSGGVSFMDNGSLLYFMPSYNPYAPQTFLGADGKHHRFSSSEGMSCHSWDSTYTGDATYQNPTSWGLRSAIGSNGSTKSNGFNSKRSLTDFNERSPNYPLDIRSRRVTSNIAQSGLQSQHLCSLNTPGAAYQFEGVAKGNQPFPNFSSFAYHNESLFGNNSMVYAPTRREKTYANGESEELTCGPRAHSSMLENEQSGNSFKTDEYNLDEFQTKYEHAKFYIIKSYSEDDVHKCVKYDVWSSTPNGNKKLDAAFHEAQERARETGSRCPVFLLFSVNGSGQFVGVAEMIGPVVFEKNMDFWQLDKWSGFFPVKWHIVKDIPNSQLRHIILENNDNRPVTYTRDTQEVGLEQGLEMLDIFKSYPSKTSLLDDLSFYENREKLLKARRMSKVGFQPEKTSKSGEGSIGSLDPGSSLVSLTQNLSLNTSMAKDKPAT